MTNAWPTASNCGAAQPSSGECPPTCQRKRQVQPIMLCMKLYMLLQSSNLPAPLFTKITFLCVFLRLGQQGGDSQQIFFQTCLLPTGQRFFGGAPTRDSVELPWLQSPPLCRCKRSSLVHVGNRFARSWIDLAMAGRVNKHEHPRQQRCTLSFDITLHISNTFNAGNLQSLRHGD